jgi:hypothetical protein
MVPLHLRQWMIQVRVESHGASAWMYASDVSRAIDAFAVVLLLAAAAAFGSGIFALGQKDDFKAVYLLVVGALSLRGSTELLRPRGGGA